MKNFGMNLQVVIPGKRALIFYQMVGECSRAEILCKV
jgi:hypothetical protein